VERPTDVETTVRGAAFAAALGAGLVKNVSELKTLSKQDRAFVPAWTPAETKAYMQIWRRRIKALLAGAY
jgi:glycerol kinase